MATRSDFFFLFQDSVSLCTWLPWNLLCGLTDLPASSSSAPPPGAPAPQVGVLRENTCWSSDWSIKPKNAVLTLPLHNVLLFLRTLHLFDIPRLINHEECSNIPPGKSGAQRHRELVFLENGSRGRARATSLMAKVVGGVCVHTDASDFWPLLLPTF